MSENETDQPDLRGESTQQVAVPMTSETWRSSNNKTLFKERNMDEAVTGNDIVVGRATLPWACAIKRERMKIPSGWVIPGGRRIQDRDKALRIARKMNDLMRDQ